MGIEIEKSEEVSAYKQSEHTFFQICSSTDGVIISWGHSLGFETKPSSRIPGRGDSYTRECPSSAEDNFCL